MCRRCPPPPHSSRASSVTNSSQFWKNLFCTCNNPNGKNVCEVCNFLFVLEMSVCFRVFVELDYLPACKILIAHCIYEGSLKTWSLRPDEKCFSIWNPSQRADAVSTVLCVSVVNELPDIQFFSSCPPPPTCWPDSLKVVTVNTKPQWLSSFAALCGHAVRHWIIIFFLIALSIVGFVCQAIMWSDFHSGKFLGNGYWVVMSSTVVAPSHKVWYSSVKYVL